MSVRNELICPQCRKSLTYVTEPYCLKCGKKMTNSTRMYCSFCEKTAVPFDEGRAVFVYDDTIRKSIYRFKYNSRKEYAKFYAEQIVSVFGDKIKKWGVDVIIPIPLHKSKLRKRGFNQAYLISKEISYLTKIPVDKHILTREKKTEKQKELGAYGRSTNIKNAFKMSSNRVQYLSAMLIDDIYTTGATMCAASKVLKMGGIKHVYCISLSIGRDVEGKPDDMTADDITVN